MNNNRPTFIGVGAQKAGTTWLADCLADHPEIFVTYPKELFFFNSSPGHQFLNEQKNWERGFDWYEAQYEMAEKFPVRGEFCTLYLPDPEAVDHIADAYPCCKIIVALRNPVERAASSFAHLIRMAAMHDVPNVPADFFSAAKIAPGILTFGKYKDQLASYLKRFRAENVKVVFYDDIKARPLDVIRDLWRFLGVKSDFVPDHLRSRSNPRSVPRFSTIERGLHGMSSLMSRIGLEEQVRALKRKGVHHKVRQWNAQPDRITFSEQETDQLLKYYKEDIEWLESTFDRNLSHWKQAGTSSVVL